VGVLRWIGKLMGQWRSQVDEVQPPAPPPEPLVPPPVAIPPDIDPPAPPLNERERTLPPVPDDDSDQPITHEPI
jgi:hypothetical protein